ncbi:ABC transporter permease [Catalinimonas alkaloidigena]|nr:ABC transporter permease [Catalinimonas alkaloidigena]
MFRNYFLIALRSFRKHKTFSLINLVGLTLGLTAGLLIFAWVLDETRYDQFHREADRVFRVQTYWGDDPQTDQYATTPPPLAEVIKSEVPEVEAVARVFTWNASTMRLPENEDRAFRETRIFIADPNFLEVLDCHLIRGEAETALKDPQSIVITKATALRYFGQEAWDQNQVLGRSILFGGDRTPRHVTGVVDPPAQTHFPFDMLVNIHFGYDEFAYNDNWAWNIVHTYIKVKPGVQTDPAAMAALERQFDRIVQQYSLPYLRQNTAWQPPSDMRFDYRLIPVEDIHLHSHLLREHTPNGSIWVVYTLTAVGLLILLLAAINFTNLSTALATRRAKEIGVRKVLGASRATVVTLFLSESMLFTLVAFAAAFGLAELLRRPFYQLSGKELDFSWLGQPQWFGLVALGLVALGLLTGSYPALAFSRFQPLRVLKGQGGIVGQGHRLRNVLVTLQFTIAIALLMGTGLVVAQLRFMRQQELGYNRENVLIIKNDREVTDRWREFKEQLEALPTVRSASFATGLPSQPLVQVRDFRPEGGAEGQGLQWFLVDDAYLGTLGLELADGHNFRRDGTAEQQSGLLLNEAAVRALGLHDPVGTWILKNEGMDDAQRLQVIGVVKDFNLESFHSAVKPLAMQYFIPDPPGMTDYVAVRLAPTQGTANSLDQSLRAIENVWQHFEAEDPFVYSFLDQDYDALFRSEQRLSGVLNWFTGLTLFIACLGLFGLSLYSTVQRTKEIGIRKVLGASVGGVLLMLSREYLRLIVVAVVIAIPLANYFATEWLHNFAYHIDIRWWWFLLPGMMTLAVALLSVSVQSLRAARANPVEALRYE